MVLEMSELQKMFNEANNFEKEYTKIMKIRLNQTQICELRHMVFDHYCQWNTLTRKEIIEMKKYVIEVFSKE